MVYKTPSAKHSAQSCLCWFFHLIRISLLQLFIPSQIVDVGFWNADLFRQLDVLFDHSSDFPVIFLDFFLGRFLVHDFAEYLVVIVQSVESVRHCLDLYRRCLNLFNCFRFHIEMHYDLRLNSCKQNLRTTKRYLELIWCYLPPQSTTISSTWR